jgi:hypothetical protein
MAQSNEKYDATAGGGGKKAYVANKGPLSGPLPAGEAAR